MAGGATNKWAGSQIGIITGFAGASPAVALGTAVTKANPAVVTKTSHGLLSGQVVKIAGVVGMTDLNGQVAVVQNLSSSTYALVGIDSTGYGTYTSGGTIQLATTSNFCELTGYNRTGGSAPEIDTTSLCSTAAEFTLGLPDFGTTQADFKFAPQTAIQQAIKALQLSGDITGFVVKLPGAGGTRVQLGFIQSTSEQAANGGIWTGSMTLRNTGAPADFAST